MNLLEALHRQALLGACQTGVAAGRHVWSCTRGAAAAATAAWKIRAAAHVQPQAQHIGRAQHSPRAAALLAWAPACPLLQGCNVCYPGGAAGACTPQPGGTGGSSRDVRGWYREAAAAAAAGDAAGAGAGPAAPVVHSAVAPAAAAAAATATAAAGPASHVSPAAAATAAARGRARAAAECSCGGASSGSGSGRSRSSGPGVSSSGGGRGGPSTTAGAYQYCAGARPDRAATASGDGRSIGSAHSVYPAVAAAATAAPAALVIGSPAACIHAEPAAAAAGAAAAAAAAARAAAAGPGANLP